MASLVLALVLFAQVVCGEKPPPANLPFLKLDFYHIKTPQLIGIIAGCIVFTVTISVVIYLLYASGTLSRAVQEIVEDANGLKPRTTAGSAAQPQVSAAPQFQHEPELYEHLLRARESLPVTPSIPSMSGKQIQIRELQEKDIEFLFSTCNGSPVFHESAYDPSRIWGWTENSEHTKPWTSLDAFKQYLDGFAKSGCHTVILDAEFKRPIGLISITDNNLSNLSIRIGNIWITPAFQGTKRSHEALFWLVKHLVDIGRELSAYGEESLAHFSSCLVGPAASYSRSLRLCGSPVPFSISSLSLGAQATVE